MRWETERRWGGESLTQEAETGRAYILPRQRGARPSTDTSAPIGATRSTESPLLRPHWLPWPDGFPVSHVGVGFRRIPLHSHNPPPPPALFAVDETRLVGLRDFILSRNYCLEVIPYMFHYEIKNMVWCHVMLCYVMPPPCPVVSHLLQHQAGAGSNVQQHNFWNETKLSEKNELSSSGNCICGAKNSL